MSLRIRRAARPIILLASALVAAACMRGFQLKKYPTSESLFTASKAEFDKRHYENAITGFEKLTLDLSARDTLLPMSHWYLAQAHEKQGEHILAASSFIRLAESFPDDSLADDALLAAATAYLKNWKNPELDPQYGTLAQVQLRSLLGVYPEGPLRPQAEAMLRDIDERFAAKDYENGMFYVRRGAFDSSLIYFKDIVKNYPNSDHVRLALLRMLEVYRKPQMNYKEEAAETCVTLRTAYGKDKDVLVACGTAPAAADSAAKPVKPVKPADESSRAAR